MTSSSCDSCGAEALANVRGRWLCARCGLAETNRMSNDASVEIGRRLALRRYFRAAIGSSLAAKLLIGVAAVAAVGGVIVTDPAIDSSGGHAVTATTASHPVAPTSTIGPAAAAGTRESEVTVPQAPPVTTPEGMRPEVADFVVDLAIWTDCVQRAAQSFASEGRETRTGLDKDQCGDRPEPPGGKGDQDPPGPPTSTPGRGQEQTQEPKSKTAGGNR